MTIISNLKIICVEDDETDRRIFEVVVKKILPHIEITFIKDGEDFVNFICKQGNYKNRDPLRAYYLIFLDISMPKMNGLDVLKKLKMSAALTNKTTELPIVMLSTSQREQDINESQRLGAIDYLIKPFSYQEMMNSLSQAINSYIQKGLIKEVEI